MLIDIFLLTHQRQDMRKWGLILGHDGDAVTGQVKGGETLKQGTSQMSFLGGFGPEWMTIIFFEPF